MRLFSLLFIFLVLSCSDNPSLVDWSKVNVDPLREAFKRNQVKSYYQVLHGIDYEGEKFSYKSDSANYNEDGYLTSFFQLDDFLGGTRYFNSYDTLNRLTAQVMRSCVGSDFIFKYESNEKLGVEKMYDIVRNDTILFSKSIYSFDEENDRLSSKVEYRKDSNDTIDFCVFRYANNKLMNIDGRRQSIRYTYNDVGALTKILKVFHDENGNDLPDETDYISTSTGLIDSTTLDEFGWVKYYSYKFRNEVQ